MNGWNAECRQIGRFNGPWPVTDDLQMKKPKHHKHHNKGIDDDTETESESENQESESENENEDSDEAEAFAQLPTCDQWITTNCQPVCTRDLTVGCTEERTPEPPKRDRFEGKWTHKPSQTTIQPRLLPRDGVGNFP